MLAPAKTPPDVITKLNAEINRILASDDMKPRIAEQGADLLLMSAGVLFGKHPMVPSISPKKSWEGFAGSLVFCVAAGVAIAPGAAPTPLSEPTTARGCEERISTLLSGASIQFTAGEATIDASSDPLLDRISQAIRSCPGVVRIEGHSDTSGNAVTNHALSVARAKAVREVMLQLGLPDNKVEAVGLGSSRPVAPNDTPEGRALNRRIEFHAL